MRFVIVADGKTAKTARPVLATADPEIVAATRRALAKLCGAER